MVEQKRTYGGPTGPPSTDRASVTRYAVVFRAGQEQPTAGALVIGAEGLRLEGAAAAARVELDIAYAELTDVRVGRNPRERLNGRPTLLLGRAGKPPIQIEPYGLGLLGEIADLLATLTAQLESGERVAVIVPLKKGHLARVEELIAQGPPFDPAALNLTRHQIYLSAQQATFIFVGPNVRATLARAARDPTLWRVGLAWRASITGPPRLANLPKTPPGHDARLVYTWPPADNQQEEWPHARQ
jgi:hypothetical protein